MNFRILVLALALAASSVTGQQNCDVQKCLNMANPLIRDPRFIFPVSTQEIDAVCTLWTSLSDCVRDFVTRCLDDMKRREFEKAVADAVDSVRKLCVDSAYRKEYLQNANCIKLVSVEEKRCGRYFGRLVDLVQMGQSPFKEDALCCNFMKFHNCILRKTEAECGSGTSAFARNMVDKASVFLIRQCQSFTEPQRLDDCPGSPEVNSNLLGAQQGLSQTGVAPPPSWVPEPVPRSTPRWSYNLQEAQANSESLQGGSGMVNTGSATLVTLVLAGIAFHGRFF